MSEVSVHLVAGVCEGLAHGELVVLILLVEAEGEAEDVGVAVCWGPVVEHMAGGHPLPSGSENTKPLQDWPWLFAGWKFSKVSL